MKEKKKKKKKIDIKRREKKEDIPISVLPVIPDFTTNELLLF